MKCPMKFNNPCYDEDDECCGFDCMWYQRISVNNEHNYGCAAVMNSFASILAGTKGYDIDFGIPAFNGLANGNNKEGN